MLLARRLTRDYFCSRFYKTLRIGDVTVKLQPPRQRHLVPKGYAKRQFTQSTLQVLKWLAQKEQLKQDVFLIGLPGSSRRQLVLSYLELMEYEYEYLALTRDVTEADIKQRREVRAGSANYVDQAAVRAALYGRALVLDGIEKAERNVLPILNNLLENREMQLDDGRFLVAPEKYDKLLKEYSEEELRKRGLIRVDERFRVIALGLPVPKFRGHPLDPPLRSRFQARNVGPDSFKDRLETVHALAPKVKMDKLNQVASFGYSLLADESAQLALPEFPVDNLPMAAQMWNINPYLTSEEIVEMLYPYTSFLKKEGIDNVRNALKTFDVPTSKKADRDAVTAVVDRVTGQENDDSPGRIIEMRWNKKRLEFEVAGANPTRETNDQSGYVSNSFHDRILCKSLLSHAVGDSCIIGPKGCGKTMVVKRFAELLGYDIVPIVLYQDLTSRDLLQRRHMLPNGDTVWKHSPLVDAALNGHLAVLDGIHRLHHSTLNLLQRLVHEREVELFDGTRLLRLDRYELIKSEESLSDGQMKERKFYPIHPSFRIIALAEPPNLRDSSSGGQWLTPELLTLFMYHQMEPLNPREEMLVISSSVKNVTEAVEDQLLRFVEKLRHSQDNNLRALTSSLSTRQLIRIMKRLTLYPDETLNSMINKACLSRFLPHLTKSALNQALEASGILGEQSGETKEITYDIKDEQLRIGSTTSPIHGTSNPALVPDILFYDNQEHLKILEDMLRDFLLGEHLLLIGNQGVGKNKIADRFLQLLNRPRQYIQLHRDTTVQTLTLQSTVVDGVVVYDDSPLVKAVKHGHVLVIDEGDKAPTHVTCILKSLLEAGEMYLGDGRCVKPPNYSGPDDVNIIRMHPDFRVILLANRPGFPFLGNDFYSSLGDLFSCHVVDNPSKESELSMLRQYAPDVDQDTLEKLASAFSELRHMADENLINYPYSTRELVNIVKHLQRYKTDGVPFVLGNVFDFDAYDKDVSMTIRKVLAKHGLPVAVEQRHVEVKLAQKYPVDAPKKIGRWGVITDENADVQAKELKGEKAPLMMKNPFLCRPTTFPLGRLDSRTERFTEQQAYWQLPLSEMHIISDVVASSSTGDIFVASVNPVCVHRINPSGKSGFTYDLSELFSNASLSSWFKPRVKLAVLGPASGFMNTVLLHEELTNTLLLVDVQTNECIAVDLRAILSSRNPVDMVAQVVKGITKSDESYFRLLPLFADKGQFMIYEKGGTRICLLDFPQGRVHSLDTPSPMDSCHFTGENVALVKLRDGGLAKLELSDSPLLWTVLGNVPSSIMDIRTMSSVGTHELMLQKCLDEKIVSPNRIFTMEKNPDNGGSSYYGAISIGFPEMTGPGDVFAYFKPAEPLINLRSPDASRLYSKFIHPYSSTSILPQLAQIVNALPNWKVPEKVVKKRDVNLNNTAGFLEVIDLPNKLATYLPVQSPKFAGMYSSWQCTLMEAAFTLAPYGSEGVVTVDSAGGVRTWETSLGGLQNSLAAWKRMLGIEQEPVQLTIEKTDADLGKLSEPKHGVVDPTGAPHVGGTTFAGGSGGYNTAGLGGVGGPYRLDIGQKVYQLPQQVKDDVPEHIREKAREMAQKAYKQRLKEIQMSQFDADMYEKFRNRVDKQVAQLRAVIESLQAKSKERQWVRHQTSGDFDDGKLIEGMTGEKNVYRRRAEKEPEPGTPQMKPKLLRLCVDVSGSMYRFNGYDGRLQRSLESCLMLMEALKGYEEKIKYEIIGHSGDEASVPFVEINNPPKNEKERLDVLKYMLAHSQYCYSGDNTLESTRLAVKQLTNEDADERFLIVLSDANFDRYGISAAQFADAMTADERVNAFVVFIGSLGDQATRLKRTLPVSKAFVCTDTSMLPQILQTIFTSTIASASGE